MSDLYYSVIENDPDHRFEAPEDAGDKVAGISSWLIQVAAQECAENYWNDHDGWEVEWPVTIAIFESEDGPEIVRVPVDMEMRPRFFAGDINPNQEKGHAEP